MHIANSADGRKILYDIDPIKKVEGPIKSGPTTTGAIVSQTSQNVKGAATHDNRLTETEKLTVVGGIGQESISNQGGKSPAVSSNCIIDTFQGFVNTKVPLAPIGKDRQTKQTPSSEEVQFAEATPIAPVRKENSADFEYSQQNLDNYAKELFGQKYADAEAKGDFAARNRMYAEALEDLATELGIDHDSRAEYVKKNGSSEEFADVNYSVYLDNLIRKNVPAASGKQYSLAIKHTNGDVEHRADARNLTTQEALSYLKLAKAKKLMGGTYIPVRKDTPQVIIDTMANVNEDVENRSLVMQVRKAQQAMSAKEDHTKNKKYGDNTREHGLTPDQIVEIIENLDNPTMAIYQTNRTDKNGNALPNNAVFFVEYNDNGNEGVAVIEFGSEIDPEAIGTDFGETNYHTVVTVFEPDVVRDETDFDYAEELLSNPNNFEIEIERRHPVGSDTREKHPITSNKMPSAIIIPQSSQNVNTKFSLTDSAGKQLSEEEVQKAKEANSKLKDVDVQYDPNSETASYSLTSLENAFSYSNGRVEYLKARDEYVDALVETTGKTRDEANRYLDSLFLVHDMIANGRDRLDYRKKTTPSGKQHCISQTPQTAEKSCMILIQ